MSLRPHHDTSGDNTGGQSPEIHHPTPTRPQALRRVSIATETDERSGWVRYAPASAVLNSEKAEPSDEGSSPVVASTNIQRSPSAPPAMNYHPHGPPPTTIHPVLDIPPALRASARPRMRLTWDVRFSPDAPPPPPLVHGRRGSTDSTVRSRYITRPRSNTQPADLGLNPDLTLAADMHARLNLNYNSQPGLPEDGVGQTFASHPIALEPATSPPRKRMLIVCRDLLPWLIPIYARDPAVGCTVLDVVRGIHAALQTKVEVAGHARTASDVARANRERRRVDWLRDKTVFVCLGRDEALARRRLPGRTTLWEETFVLTLARRRMI